MKIETAVPVRSFASILPTTAQAAVAQPVDSFTVAPASTSQVAAVEAAPIPFKGFEATAIAQCGDYSYDIMGKLPSGEEVIVVAEFDEQGKLSPGHFRLLSDGGERQLTRSEIGQLAYWGLLDSRITVSGMSDSGEVPKLTDIRAAINEAVDLPFEGFTPTEVLQCAGAASFDIVGTYANGDFGTAHVVTDGAGHVTEVSSERSLDGEHGDGWATHDFSLAEMALLASALRASSGLPMRAVDRLEPIGVDALTAKIQAAVDAA